MRRFLVRRFVYMIITVWIISMVAFAVIQLPPGDYVTNMVSEMMSQGMDDIDPSVIAQLREQYGLNDPIYVQYFKWIGNIITKGDFGYSLDLRRDARELILERLPLTFTITGLSVLFIWAISLPVGIFSAVRKYSIGDYIITSLGFIGIAIPNFLFALVLMYLSYKYGGKALIGLFSPEFAGAPWSWAKVQDLFGHVWIPVIIIGLSGTAGLIRITRANLLDELNRPYVDTARAKGLPERRLLWKYPVRYALNPFISGIGFELPRLVAGEVVVSIVLNLPTSGPILFNALVEQDMYVAAGFILMLSALTVIGVFISDVLLLALDPRIRLE